MLLNIIATWDAEDNDPKKGAYIVDNRKLTEIYRELRSKVFTEEPLQDFSGDNGAVIKRKSYPHWDLGNYGWQLFKTPSGTAMLEYIGPVSYESHTRRPHPLGKEEHLKMIEITFHQEEEAYQKVKAIVDEQSILALQRLRNHSV